MEIVDAVFTGINFNQCSFKQANFSHIKAMNIKFDRAYVTFCDFSDATFKGTNLSFSNFYRSSFSLSLIENVDFRGVDLSKTNFLSTKLIDIQVYSSMFDGCNLKSSVFDEMYISEIDMKKSTFDNVILGDNKVHSTFGLPVIACQMPDTDSFDTMTTIQYWSPLRLVATKNFCGSPEDFKALVEGNKEKDTVLYENLKATLNYIKAVARLD